MQTMTDEPVEEMSDDSLALIKGMCREDIERFHAQLRHFLKMIDAAGPTLFKRGVISAGQHETVRRIYYDLSQVSIYLSALLHDLENDCGPSRANATARW